MPKRCCRCNPHGGLVFSFFRRLEQVEGRNDAQSVLLWTFARCQASVERWYRLA